MSKVLSQIKGSRPFFAFYAFPIPLLDEISTCTENGIFQNQTGDGYSTSIEKKALGSYVHTSMIHLMKW